MRKSACFFSGLLLFIGAVFSAEQEFIHFMQKARQRLEIVTPGIFSPDIIKIIQRLSENQIRIRILTDCTFLGSPENLIDLLNNSPISIRVIPDKLAISHNILIIDEEKVLFGGSHFKDNNSVFSEAIELEEKAKTQSFSTQFQSIWTGIDPRQSNLLLKDAAFFIDTDTVSTKSEPKSINPYKPNDKKLPDNQSQPFAASVNSRIYHKSDSPFIKRIKKSNLIFFATEEEAIKSGRKPAANF